MKKYEIFKDVIEVSYKNREKIKEGVILTQDFREPTKIVSCGTLNEAERELLKYNSSITELSGTTGKYYLVEEYYIQENEYDEDDEWLSGGDIWGFSKIIIELVEKPSYETLATFDNMAEAEKALENCENEAFLKFI